MDQTSTEVKNEQKFAQERFQNHIEIIKKTIQNHSFEGPRAVLERLGACCGRLGSFWGDFLSVWRGLEGSLARLGASWADLGMSWGGPGAPWGDLGVVLRGPRVSFSPS